jgi:hypothetical protein
LPLAVTARNVHLHTINPDYKLKMRTWEESVTGKFICSTIKAPPRSGIFDLLGMFVGNSEQYIFDQYQDFLYRKSAFTCNCCSCSTRRGPSRPQLCWLHLGTRIPANRHTDVAGYAKFPEQWSKICIAQQSGKERVYQSFATKALHWIGFVNFASFRTARIS